MFVTPAFAQTGGVLRRRADMLIQFLPDHPDLRDHVLPDHPAAAQKAKKHQEMVANVRRGDTVVTSGGLIGKVAKVVDEGEVQVELAEGVRVRVVRGMIAEVRAKGEPVKEDG